VIDGTTTSASGWSGQPTGRLPPQAGRAGGVYFGGGFEQVDDGAVDSRREPDARSPLAVVGDFARTRCPLHM